MHFETLLKHSSKAAGSAKQEKRGQAEISIRHFNPEDIQDLADLHDIDLDTRDSTVDVTGAESAISPEDLREWMQDPLLLAMDQKGRAFGFAWVTEDTNIRYAPIQHTLSAIGNFPVHNIMEYSHGELKRTRKETIQKGLERSLSKYASTMEAPPVLTAYTTDSLEGEFLQAIGFRPLGTVPAYYGKMDDGKVELVNEPHLLFAIDLASIAPRS